MARPKNCPKCRAPMRRTAFERNERDDSVFHYTCTRCRHTETKTFAGALEDPGAEKRMSRPRPQLDDVARVDALRAELRRMRGEVRRLEEEKQDLERRNAHLQRELEQARAKIPRGMSTS